jgi:hypothetical protein
LVLLPRPKHDLQEQEQHGNPYHPDKYFFHTGHQ